MEFTTTCRMITSLFTLYLVSFPLVDHNSSYICPNKNKFLVQNDQNLQQTELFAKRG